MSVAKTENFPKKTRMLLLDEVEPEQWSSWVRIGIAAGYLLLCTYSFARGHLLSAIYTIQLCAVFGVFAYSGAYLFVYNKGRIGFYILFALIFFDVSIVTIINWSTSVGQDPMTPYGAGFFSAYLIVIMINALHSRKRLSLVSGALSLAAYSMLYFSFLQQYSTDEAPHNFLTRASFIVAATILSMIVAHRNYYTMSRIISSEIRYQKLVQRLPEMLFTLDANGRIIWTNTASMTILGIPADDIQNRPLRDFLAIPGELKLDKNEFRATFQLKDSGTGIKYVDCFLQALKKNNANHLFEGIMTDVTDREIAISQREEMVQRLYQYQKMESLGTLASGMAHDFNNILQTINDIVAQIENETGETATKKSMADLSECLLDAKFLVSELLALGRKQPLDSKTIILQDFFNAIVPQFSKQLGKNYLLKCNLPDAPLRIQGDADYFKRVFQNLVGNARDALSTGGTITFECSLRKSSGKSGTVVIRVIDTGTGIAPEFAGKIFDPFFTTKKPGKGTGLGLALVQRIVSLHNGTVVLEKTSPRGTTFRIEIPESEQSDSDVDTKEILLTRRSTRVLILDDDPKIRSILRFFLSEFKYPLCEASDVEGGVRELTKYAAECDLVIMDWRLGLDDPHDVIRRLRAIKPDLIVIVVSGYTARKESIQSMNIFKWIIKPYEKNQLDFEIQKALYAHSKK